MMNFIDISSRQSGLDLGALFGTDNHLDGVMVKLTQGTAYVNPDANAWITWLTLNQKPFGTYHYLDGSGAEAEARHYATEAKKWPGGVLALDYEDHAIVKGTGYLKACMDEVYRLTGARPMVYCSQSVIQAQDFAAIAAAGYKLWVAQYADMKTVNGFVAEPWHSGSPAPFSAFTMRQYTSCGRLIGWGNNLDFDLFYGTADDWKALAGSSAPAPAPTPSKPKGPDPQVISDILDGKYGTGQERVQKLTAAGYDAEAVQKKVNELYGIALTIKKKLAGNEQYLDQIFWIVRQL